MTKAEIISYVKNNLQKIDKTNKYHRIVIEKAITLAFNQGYSDIFDQDPRLLDSYTKTYGADGSPVTIAAAANSGIFTATIPVPYVPFKDKKSGVRNIAPVVPGSFKFYPITKYEFEILPNTITGELNTNDPRGYFVVRGGTVEFFGVDAVAASGCRMDIVIPFDEYGSTDQVLIPFAKDFLLVGGVVEALRTIPKVDLSDNNADKE